MELVAQRNGSVKVFGIHPVLLPGGRRSITQKLAVQLHYRLDQIIVKVILGRMDHGLVFSVAQKSIAPFAGEMSESPSRAGLWEFRAPAGQFGNRFAGHSLLSG